MDLHKLVPVEAAHSLIEATEFTRPAIENVAVYTSYWRISASDIVAKRSIPSRPVAAMDGYALRISDVNEFGVLKLVGEVKPEDEPPELRPGEAYYVHVGAPIPLGADAASRVEATRVEDGKVKPLEPLKPGKDVMRIGEVIEEGSRIVGMGEIISPYKVTLLMMQGYREIPVYRVRVGVLSVGDEIDPYDKASGKPVIDSIAPTVIGLLRFAEPHYLGVVGDNVNEIRQAIESSISKLDALLTIGGASIGGSDNVKNVLARMGNMLFPGVAASVVKRGSVTVVERKPIVTLPGLCVSAALVFHEFFLHTLSRMVGGDAREYIEARLSQDLEVKHRMDTAYLFDIIGDQAKPLKWGTGLCMELAKAKAFTVLKRGFHPQGEILRLQKLLT